MAREFLGIKGEEAIPIAALIEEIMIEVAAVLEGAVAEEEEEEEEEEVITIAAPLAQATEIYSHEPTPAS